MKEIKILFVALICSISTFAQVTNYKSKWFCKSTNMVTFGEYFPNTTKVTIDMDYKSIVIFTADRQVLTFTGQEKKYYDEDGFKTYETMCKDKNGVSVRVRIKDRPDTNGVMVKQLFIHYTNVILCYTMYPVK